MDFINGADFNGRHDCFIRGNTITIENAIEINKVLGGSSRHYRADATDSSRVRSMYR